jgi:hypothetical protein
VALFLNYPLTFFGAALDPLPFLNQAATPLYSLTWGILGTLEPFYVRLVTISLLVFLSLFLISQISEQGTLLGVVSATLSILLYDPALVMLSEMKHYGLEILSSLIVITWFTRKDLHSKINNIDILILSLALVTGMSTIPVGPIALATFLAIRILRGISPRKLELVRIAAYLGLVFAYYLLAKRVTLYQLSNYPEAYFFHGPLQAVSTLLRNIRSLDPRASLKYLFAFSVVPLTLVGLNSVGSVRSRRLIILFVVVLITYIALAGIGIYPASAQRHVVWLISYFWVFMASSICILYRFVKSRTSSPLLLSLPFLIPVFAVQGRYRYIWNSSPEDLSISDNKAAISYLASQPKSKIFFWYGGGYVYHYFLRFNPNLSKHEIGLSRPGRSSLRSILNPKSHDPRKSDMLPSALNAIRHAKPGEDFIVFGSHYDWEGKWGGQVNVAQSIINAFGARDCSYRVKGFSGAVVYHVNCKT